MKESILKIVLTLLLAFIWASARPQAKNYNSYLENLKSKKDQEERWQALADISQFCLENSDQRLLDHAKEMRSFADSTANPERQYLAYAMMGSGTMLISDYERAFRYDSTAQVFAQMTGNPENLYDVLFRRGAHYAQTNQLERAQQYYDEALITAKLTGKESLIAKTFLTKGMAYTQSARFRSSVAPLRFALDYYYKNPIRKYLNDSRHALAWAYLELGKLDSCQFLMSQLLDDMATNGSDWMSDMQAHSILSKVHFYNGNYNKGIESIEKVQKALSQVGIERGVNLAEIDKASLYLSIKNYKEAKLSIEKATAYFKKDQYYSGNILINIVNADYCSRLGKNDMALRYFKSAEKDMAKAEYQDVEEEYLRTLYEHYYRINNQRAGDSTLLKYASYILDHKEPETVRFKLDQYREKNPGANPELIKILDMIYSKNGQLKLKNLLKNKTFQELIPLNEVLSVNPYSMATPTFDSLSNIRYNESFLELQAKYKANEQKDSLIVKQLELTDASQKIRKREGLIKTTVIIAFFMLIILFYIYKSRKKAIVAKREISRLHDEVHHSVKNQISFIKRAIDETEASNDIELAELKARLVSVEKLQELVYKQKETGMIPMKEYFEEMCVEAAKIFLPQKEVHVFVDCNISLPKNEATIFGRIVAELATNSLKHAFSYTEKPSISISYQDKKNGKYELHYSDNGSGIAGEIRDSFGQRFLKGTTKTTLNGHLESYNNGGTHFIITYPKDYHANK